MEQIGQDDYIIRLSERGDLRGVDLGQDRKEVYWKGPGWYVIQKRLEPCRCGCGASEYVLFVHTVESVRLDLYEEMCDLAKRYKALKACQARLETP